MTIFSLGLVTWASDAGWSAAELKGIFSNCSSVLAPRTLTIKFKSVFSLTGSDLLIIKSLGGSFNLKVHVPLSTNFPKISLMLPCILNFVPARLALVYTMRNTFGLSCPFELHCVNGFRPRAMEAQVALVFMFTSRLRNSIVASILILHPCNKALFGCHESRNNICRTRVGSQQQAGVSTE